jgi:hypothetical protein
MKTDNELIAEFMGISYNDQTYNTPKVFIRSLWRDPEYEKSWDWLMPVVEKIANLYANSNHDRHWSKAVNDLRMPILSTTIGYVYKAVIEFIKWYRTQNTNEPIV